MCLNIHDMNNNDAQEIHILFLNFLITIPSLSKRKIAEKISIGLGKFSYRFKSKGLSSNGFGEIDIVSPNLYWQESMILTVTAPQMYC